MRAAIYTRISLDQTGDGWAFSAISTNALRRPSA